MDPPVTSIENVYISGHLHLCKSICHFLHPHLQWAFSLFLSLCCQLTCLLSHFICHQVFSPCCFSSSIQLSHIGPLTFPKKHTSINLDTRLSSRVICCSGVVSRLITISERMHRPMMSHQDKAFCLHRHIFEMM